MTCRGPSVKPSGSPAGQELPCGVEPTGQRSRWVKTACKGPKELSQRSGRWRWCVSWPDVISTHHSRYRHHFCRASVAHFCEPPTRTPQATWLTRPGVTELAVSLRQYLPCWGRRAHDVRKPRGHRLLRADTALGPAAPWGGGQGSGQVTSAESTKFGFNYGFRERHRSVCCQEL